MLNQSNNTGRIVGAVCTALYALLVVGLILWGRFTIHHKEVIQGMIVDFGVSEHIGYGEENPITADNVSREEPTATPEDVNIQTQTNEAAPEAVDRNTETNPQVVIEQQKPVEENPSEVKDEPKINQLALFPGNNTVGESVNEGEVENTVGDQGHNSGAEAKNHVGFGNIDGYVPDWTLDGRKLLNKLVIPPYKGREEGIVIIEICVNAKGEVTSTEFKAKGSTVTSTSPLVTEAKKSAKTAQFSPAEQDFQFGTITFKYVLNAK